MSERVFNKEAFEPIYYDSNNWVFRIRKTWQKNLFYQLYIKRVIILIGIAKYFSFGIEFGKRNAQINSAFLYINISW